MSNAPQRVLVTGAGGFLGVHLCRYLVSNGFRGRVTAFDNFSTGSRARLDALKDPRLEVVSGDILQAEDIVPAADDAEVIIHLAAISDPRVCDENPSLANAVNVRGTQSVLSASSGKRIVFLSTAMVYGTQGEHPLTEESPLLGQGVYASTKLEGEHMCLAAARRGDVEAAIVRNFNSYGGGQADGFLIPKLVKQGLKGAIEIWNCQPVRDFTYVDDTVRAVAMLALAPGVEGIFNLGSGTPTKVGDLAVEVGRALEAPVSCLNKPVTGSAFLLASAERLRSAVGWEPQVDLADGIARTIRWYQENGEPGLSFASPSRPGKQAA